jgi:ABC-type multidrug transport system permease subunit
MTTRQLLNRNSYVLASAVVLMLAAYFVARVGNWEAWIAWIVAVLLLYTGFLALRPGAGSKMSEAELEQLVGAGKPILLELYSNY